MAILISVTLHKCAHLPPRNLHANHIYRHTQRIYNTLYNLDIKIQDISKNPLNVIYQVVSYTTSYLILFYFPNDLVLHVFYVQIKGAKTDFYCLRQYPK